MWNIIKSLFRYSFKNKVSLIMLTSLIFLSAAIFASLTTLSNNLSNSYDELIQKGNLNNVVINELYSSTYVDANGNEVTGDLAKVKNKEAFEKELSELIPDQFRQFHSIDFTNSSSGFAYKIIESESSYKVDKLVVYEGQSNLPETINFDSLIESADWSLDALVNQQARRLVVFLASKAQWTASEPSSVFAGAAQTISLKDDPNDNLYDPKNWVNNNNVNNNSRRTANILKMWFDKTDPNYTVPISKGYRLSLDYAVPSALVPPIVGRIDNTSGYTAVVPNYVLENHQKEIAPDYIYQELVRLNTINKNSSAIFDFNFSTLNQYGNQTEIINYISTQIPSKYKISVDNIEYVILGSGISPSFMYPVYSFERQIPNIHNEILIYSNNSGYQLAFDSARSSPTESYIVAKVSNDKLAYYIDTINTISRKYMSWPSNLRSTYSINDTSNLIAPNALRVSFLPDIVTLQISLSNALSFFTLILIGMIFVFSIKKYINDNRVSLGTLKANGIRKRTIIFSTPIFAIIPAFFGGAIAYIFSFFTQHMFLGLYSFYWTIPTAIAAFNPLIFFGIILAPFVVMSIIAMISTYFLLKTNPSRLINESSKFNISYFSMFITKLFTKSNILTKFRASIAFSSMPKLITITLMFTLLSAGSIFTAWIINKFDFIATKTFAAKDYNFSIDLITPTIQGGQYFRVQPEFNSRAVVNADNKILNYTIGMSDDWYNSLRTQNGNLLYLPPPNDLIDNFQGNRPANTVGQRLSNHLPSLNDSSWQASDFSYLANRIQTPMTIDAIVGLGPVSTNPWDVARNLMPANQVNLSNSKTHELFTTILNDENIYFNSSYLNNYPNIFPYLNTSQKNLMINKPLNQIMKDFNYFKPLPEDGLIKDQDIIFTDKNNQKWYLDKTEYNSIFRVSAPLVIIASTLMSLNSRQYDFSALQGEDLDWANSYLAQVQKYEDLFFYIYYEYVPMDVNDETYTNIKTSINNSNDIVSIKGIRPDSKKIILNNSNNQNVIDKLRLQTIDESQYSEVVDNSNPNIKSVHDIYKDPTLNDPSNFNIVINESAAYKYNLSIGNKVTINPNEEITRYNPQNLDIINDFNNQSYTFTIKDIISTYQNPEFYINQKIANSIIGLGINDDTIRDQILENAFYNEYNPTLVTDKASSFNYDVAPPVIKAIDPFNGFFTSTEVPALVDSLTLYSTSGLNPASDKFSHTSFYTKSGGLIDTVMKSTVRDLSSSSNQNKYLSKMILSEALGFRRNGTDTSELDAYYVNVLNSDPNAMISKLIDIYGQSPLLSLSTYIESKQAFSALFDNISNFVNTILALVLVIIFLITVLSVFYLSVDFISSTITISSILKVLGLKDSDNVFSFLSMFFPAIIIATIISLPISMSIINGMIHLIYNFSSMLLPFAFEWWYFLVPLTILFTMLSITVAIAIIILKRQNLAKSIGRY